MCYKLSLILRIPGSEASISFCFEDTNAKLVLPCTIATHISEASCGSNWYHIIFNHNLSSRTAIELEQLQQNLELNIQLTTEQDRISWKWVQKGVFKVKIAYFAMKDGPRIRTDVRKIWKLKAQPRMKVFEWLMALNRISTVDNLQKRGWCLVNRQCAYTMQVYVSLNQVLGTNIPVGHIESLTQPC